MPAIGVISIQNGEATPVWKTFDPVQIDSNGIAEYADVSGGIPLGMPTLTISSKKTSSGGRRVRFNLALPVLETVSGSSPSGYDPSPAVAYTVRSNHEFILPARSTTADRQDLQAFARNVLTNAVGDDLIQDVLSIY